jgi:O-succinylbenzoic acid--CoA ligase
MQDWLTARTKATPGKVSLVMGERWLTFDSLYQQVKIRADSMQSAKQPIRSGARVAVLADSSLRTLLTLHALIQIGVVTVPINTRLTPHEIEHQVQQSRCDFLLYNEMEYADTARNLDLRGTSILSFAEARQSSGHAHSQPSRRIALDDPLAIIHTSGTSGRSKGVVLTAGNFFYSAMASAYHLGHAPDDRWLCVLPLYHVGGLSIIIRGILHGVTVDLLSRFDVDAVNHALDSQPITHISLVPTMLYRLLESRTTWPESLKMILLGGAAASPELLARCRDAGVPIATTYGLTEACSQVATMLPGDVLLKPGSVGKPLMFTTVRVVDDDGKPTVPGQYGEILVSGPTVMQGYFNDPDATARTLRNGELHTGDIGYLDEEGDLWVVQRRIDLIVSGGENVYPAEVEQVLRQHPAVEDACVVGVDDAEWGQQVAAAIVLRQGTKLSEADLSAFCRERLAGYKLPRLMVFVDALPQTTSGKIRRAAVKDLFAGGS